jgi:hypothetical protein
MNRLLIVAAAAASIAACHNRSEEQTGAAPRPADTTATTHVIDSTRTGPPGEAGRPGNATVTLDSVMHDTTAVQRDTTLPSQAPTSAPQDTLGPRPSSTDSAATSEQAPTDTSGAQRQ